ncbi:MAG: hypothetical protein IPI49_18280 [Myxococcales bacterium]|nr:hypothetical protein [Myxococcales bacterium]
MIDFGTLRKYYNLCHPGEYLKADDKRYVPLDELGQDDERKRVRGENWSGKLVKMVRLSDKPVCQLLTGLPGSGKSTELRRVALGLKTESKLLPVVIDAEEVVDLASPIDVPDILLAILYHAEREVLLAEGKDPEDAGKDSILTRIGGIWSSLQVEAKGSNELTVPVVGKLGIEMKYQPDVRKRVRKAVESHIKTFLDEARRELSLLNARACKRGHEGLVIVFDSMEKLRGTSTNYQEVLESAEQIFHGGAPHLQLPVPVFYTVPIELISRRRIENVEIMPMIKLKTRAGDEFEPGFEAARQIITRRIPLEVLSEVLEPSKLEERLHALIEWSGGYPRELVRMLQRLLEAEKHPLSDQAFPPRAQPDRRRVPGQHRRQHVSVAGAHRGGQGALAGGRRAPSNRRQAALEQRHPALPQRLRLVRRPPRGSQAPRRAAGDREAPARPRSPGGMNVG